VHLVTAVSAFALTALAELPDKSMLASLVLGTRFRPLHVWLGVAAAFGVHVLLAVTAGTLLTLLPDVLVQAVVVLLFAAGAVLLWRGAGGHEHEVRVEGEDGQAGSGQAGPGADRGLPAWRVVLTAFGVVFVGEWGDITQITVTNLAARSGDPVSVAVGAVLGLWTVAALATIAGRSLLRAVPERLVRRTGAAVLAALAVLSLVQLLRG
jgi:Ca2+/H+ antiporter, TMEM165/GDT1 family